MKLSTIEIKNLRGIEDSGRICMDDFLLLVGANNSGKSTILKALDLFFNNSDFDCEHDYPIDKTNKIGFRASTTIRLTFEREPGDKLPHQLSYYFEKKRGFLNKVMSIEIEYPRKYNEKKERKIKINLKHRGSDANSDDKYNKVFQALKNCISFLYIPTERLGEKIDENEFINKLFILTLEKSITYNNILKQYRSVVKKQFTDVENNIRKSVYGFPDLKNINFDFSNINIDNLKDNIKIFVSSQQSGKVPLEKEGAGLRSSVIISIIKIIFGKNNKNNKNIILGIEEPENFLHPEAQRALINKIKHNQSIISTHSPIILNELSPKEFKNILRCYKNEKLKFFQLSNESDIKLLTRLYESSDIVGGEFFFSTRCLLVEGKTDQAIFRKQFRFNDYYSSPIFAVGSNTEFSSPISLLKNFELGIIIITDEDSLFGKNKDKFKQSLIINNIATESNWTKFVSYVSKNINKNNGTFNIFKKSRELLDLDGFILVPVTLEPSLLDYDNVDTVIKWFSSKARCKYIGIPTDDLGLIRNIEKLKTRDERLSEMKKIIITNNFKKRFIVEQLFDFLLCEKKVPKLFSDITKLIRL